METLEPEAGEEPEALSEREDAALTDAVTLDMDTLAELATGMGARVAGREDDQTKVSE